MISFEPILAGDLLMPITISVGIWKMVRANESRADAGREIQNILANNQEALFQTQEALKVSVDALRKLLERD